MIKVLIAMIKAIIHTRIFIKNLKNIVEAVNARSTLRRGQA